MMYVNLFWVWGHPEVYILVLPAFGVFSEVISTFSGKPLFGYRSMVAATMAICILSFLVWAAPLLHDGGPARTSMASFGIMTMNHCGANRRQGLQLAVHECGEGGFDSRLPLLWSLGFMVTFVIGGMTGVLMAVPPADFPGAQ